MFTTSAYCLNINFSVFFNLYHVTQSSEEIFLFPYSSKSNKILEKSMYSV